MKNVLSILRDVNNKNFFVLFSFSSLSLLFNCTTLNAQSGPKWATGLNALVAGSRFGSSNNFPILFHTNNTLRMTLGTTGVLNVNGLSGTGNRLLQTSATGEQIVNVDGYSYTSNVYVYSLYINDVLIDSKKMVVNK